MELSLVRKKADCENSSCGAAAAGSEVPDSCALLCCAPPLPLGLPGVSSSLVDVAPGEITGDGVDTGDGPHGSDGDGSIVVGSLLPAAAQHAFGLAGGSAGDFG